MDIEGLREYWENNKVIDERIRDYKLIVKNYPELCSILGEKNTTGKSKILQLKEWERYFEYDKLGNQFIIREIYETPLEKQKGEYINPIDVLNEYEMYRILKEQSNGTYDFNYMELAEELRYINQNYIYYRNKKGELTNKIFGVKFNQNKEDFINKYGIIHELYECIEDRYEYRIDKILNRLEKTGLIMIHKYYLGFKERTSCDKETIEIKNEYGDIEVKGDFFPRLLPEKVRLNKDEEQYYLNIQTEEVQKYKVDGETIIEPRELRRLGINRNTNKSFYDEWMSKVAKRAKEELGYDKIAMRYEIVTSPLFVDSKIKKLDYQIRRKGINKRFHETLLKNREHNKNRLIEVVKKENEIRNKEGFYDLSEIEQMIELIQGFDKTERKKMKIINNIAEEEKCEDKEKALNQRYKKEKSVIDAVVLIEDKKEKDGDKNE